MTSDRCQLYLEDPEAHGQHPAECASCRAIAEELRRPVDTPSVEIPSLPLASWEGAAHRSWPLVAGVILAVVAMAGAFFAIGGASPRLELARAFRSGVDWINAWAGFLSTAGNALQHAPAGLQLVIGLAFVLVNALLFVLLRRAPRGING